MVIARSKVVSQHFSGVEAEGHDRKHLLNSAFWAKIRTGYPWKKLTSINCCWMHVIWPLSFTADNFNEVKWVVSSVLRGI